MLRTRLFLIMLLSAFLVGGGIALWAAVDNDGDEKVPISDVPAKVLEAAKGAVPAGGEAIAAEKEVENGVLIYDVVVVVGDVKYEVEVTADGVVNEIEKEGDDEAEDDGDEEVEVALTDVPENVLKAAKEAVPEGNIKKVEKEVEDGVVVYDVEIFVRYEVEVTADGKVKEIEKGNDDEDSEADNDDD